MGAVYWVGQDGNIWYKGAEGTQNMGAADKYELSDSGIRGYAGTPLGEGAGFAPGTRIDDPLAGGKTLGDSTAPTGGAGSDAPVLNQAAVSATQQAIDSLGTEAAVGNRNIDEGLTSLNKRYDVEKGRAEGDYGEQTVTNNQNLQRNRQNALVGAAQGRRGLRGTLAAMGALSGSGGQLADRAVTTEVNQDLGGAAETANTNAVGLDKAIGRFREEDETRRGDATTAAGNQRTALKGSLASKRQQYYQKMAELFAEGGDTARAAEFLGKAGGLNKEIASNTRVAATPFTPGKAAFTPGDLENYMAGAGDMTVKTGEGGLGGRQDPTSILAGRGRRRDREEEELAVA